MKCGKILVRATNWVGDAVMSLPALGALREQFPQAHIAILAKPWVADLYGREPFCNEVIPYDPGKGWAGWRERWRMAQQLRQRNFDCAILLQNAFEAALIAYVARIPVRIGYNRDARGLLLTKAVAVPKAGEIALHQRFYYLELLKRAGIIDCYSNGAAVRLSGTKKAAEEGRVLLQSHGIKGSIVGVSAGAAYGGAKRWLPERFAEAAADLAKETGAQGVAVFGSEAERAVCELVSAGTNQRGVQCVNLAGRTTLAEFIQMAAACSVYLTNDSGPMHIASALGVPTVAIFGATDEKATGPAGVNSAVVREPVECSPCLLRECPIDHRCMTRVSAERVTIAAKILLEESARQTH
jgi:lipopolysaccharide heptosyltransferase II